MAKEFLIFAINDKFLLFEELQLKKFHEKKNDMMYHYMFDIFDILKHIFFDLILLLYFLYFWSFPVYQSI